MVLLHGCSWCYDYIWLPARLQVRRGLGSRHWPLGTHIIPSVAWFSPVSFQLPRSSVMDMSKQIQQNQLQMLILDVPTSFEFLSNLAGWFFPLMDRYHGPAVQNW